MTRKKKVLSLKNALKLNLKNYELIWLS